MHKIVSLSFLTTLALYSNEIELNKINVESTLLSDVSQNIAITADLADALTHNIPSIDMNRRSGIANDIYIRGQKRDNISIEVDGTKVYGACVNRMDPPVSHILASQIDEVEVIEGPYDVEVFGTMSGGLKIKTKKPKKGTNGELNLGLGSWGYKKLGATFSGGNDKVRLLLSLSTESSNQYKDGDGNTISQQIDNFILKNPRLAGTAYKDEYKDMKAYEKKSVMLKAYVSTLEDQELRLSITTNKSDNVLYGNSKMDAIYDDSNIYSLEYNINNITDNYKNINLQYYYSNVDHPMSTQFRISSNDPDMDKTNHLTTSMQGLKLKNQFSINSSLITIGLDGSQREWDGNYYNTTTGVSLNTPKSIDNSQTDNLAVFAKLKNSFDAFDISTGLRYDSSKVTHATLKSNDYHALNANIFTTYNFNEENKLFFGFGQSSRIPDARELYFTGSGGNLQGTPNLKQTTNKEIDLGYETNNELFSFKIKTFYSSLKDYIYIKKGVAVNAFENIDANLYGAEIGGSLYATDDINFDFGASYKRGTKSEALSTQTDKDLADIAPLRANLALNYDYMNNSTATVEIQASDRWDTVDEDNGEQVLAGWAIVNLKMKHALNKKANLTLGLTNLLNKTYAQSNTYVDLTLLTTGGSGDIMLMNEPGRYIYTNLDIKF